MAKPHSYADEIAALDSLTPQTHSARDAEHFRRIIATRHALAHAQDELIAAVEAAREAGDSWTVIGAALGTTRQGAFRKFGHPGEARASFEGTTAASRSASRSYGLAAESVSRTAKAAVKATPAKRATKATPAKSATRATTAKSATRATTAKGATKATPAKGATKATPAKGATKATPAKSTSRTGTAKASSRVRHPS